jgi:hypothetical protein
MASTTAATQNNVPCARKCDMAVFFARMDVVVRWQGGGCGDNGSDNDGIDVILLAATAGVGRLDESGQGGRGGRGDKSNINVVLQRVGGGRHAKRGEADDAMHDCLYRGE